VSARVLPDLGTLPNGVVATHRDSWRAVTSSAEHHTWTIGGGGIRWTASLSYSRTAVPQWSAYTITLHATGVTAGDAVRGLLEVMSS
jgi:hypothetical protein